MKLRLRKSLCVFISLFFLFILLPIDSISEDGWNEKVLLTSFEFGAITNPTIDLFNNSVRVFYRTGYNRYTFYSESIDKGNSWSEGKELNMDHITGADIASTQNSFHALFQRYYARSTDNLKTWEINKQINGSSIAINNNNIHIIRTLGRENITKNKGDVEIQYLKSTDNGDKWKKKTIQKFSLEKNNSNLFLDNPKIAVNGKDVHIICYWHYVNKTQTKGYRYFKSNDNGLNFNDSTIILNHIDLSKNILIADNNTIYLVFQNQIEHYNELSYLMSVDNGKSWAVEKTLINGKSVIYGFDFDAVNQAIHIAWIDSEDRSMIQYARSTNGGKDWDYKNVITSNEHPEIYHIELKVDKHNVHIIWETINQEDDQINEIYYKRGIFGYDTKKDSKVEHIDLSLKNFKLSNYMALIDQKVKISTDLQVKNLSESERITVIVNFYDNNILIGKDWVNITGSSVGKASIYHSFIKPGIHTINVKINPSHFILETDYTNNMANKEIEIVERKSYSSSFHLDLFMTIVLISLVVVLSKKNQD